MKDISALFNPQSVAVIGASNGAGKVGNIVMKNLVDGGYQGKIYPVNPKEKTVEGLKNYQSVLDIPTDIDLAVICIPAAFVLASVQELAKKHLKNLIVLTAGFKETGDAGAKLEADLVAFCTKHHINLLGPNVIGSIDTHAPLNASFAQVMPEPGDIAFISQSGAMLVAILDWAIAAGIGFSKVVSIGNKADISELDLIEHLSRDPHTKVILCYLESIGNGEDFLKIVSQASQKKPIVILKSGCSAAGASAASSHTGALAGSDLAYDLAFAQTGVIRAESMAELFDLGLAFSKLKLPAGKNVAVVTNAGGGGVVTADTIERLELKMAALSSKTTKALEEGLPKEASAHNPIDVLGDASPERYHLALEQAIQDKNVDAVVVMTCPTAATRPVPIAETIIDVNQLNDKPILPVNMGGITFKQANQLLKTAHLPTYVFPETAVGMVKRLAQYAAFKNQSANQTPVTTTGIDPKKVAAIFKAVKKDGRSVLLGSEAYAVATAYGIKSAPIILATTAEEAGKVAAKMGFPVVLKIASDKILHKSDVGGVKVGLKTQAEVSAAFAEIMTNVKKAHPDVTPNGIEVQKMMPKGQEVIVGMMRDPSFGPMIAFGMGGIYVNLIKDASFVLAHGLTTQAVETQLKSTKAYTLLTGYRGEDASDINSVKDTIARVARLTLDFPEIKELDINPIFVYAKGSSALDIKITI
jgi:acetyltransferase